MPITTNGKIDKKLLPEIDVSEIINVAYEAPRNDVEKKITEIWSEVLGIEKIGINDNFFEIGGNSLSLVSMVYKIKNQLNINIDLSIVYNYPTIKDMIKYNNEIQSRETVALLNNKYSKNIFAFPPIAGVNVIYSNLSKLINKYSFYSFNFINKQNLIKEYVDIIIKIQKDGPYILLGYSAGGNLAFEVAKELEKRNLNVSDIIMLDSYKRNNTNNISIKDEEELYKNILVEAKENKLYGEYLKEGIIRKKYLIM